jgi:ATP-binding cassette subfamily B protein
VAQDTYLFNDTLEANIRLAGRGESDADVRRALDRAALSEFVDRLPDGLATLVGERGVQLSGGQQIRTALEELMAQRISIITAHRLSTIQNADTILVMDAGKIVEAGSHAELLAARGAYARLVAHQSGRLAA